MQDEPSFQECYLPIFDDSREVSEKDLAAAEHFRIALSAFPVVMPALAFLGYDAVVPIFHELISFTQSWYSVDGGKLEAELIIPIINGIVQPAVAIVLGTMVTSTLTTLRDRQVSIRSCLNKEACDLRMLDATLTLMHGAAEDRALRIKYLEILRQYVTRLIVESSVSNRQREVSLTSESELDGLIHSVYSTRRNPELEGAARFYDPVRMQLPNLVQSLNHLRSHRLAELQTTYPAVHWQIMALLGGSIIVAFLIESDEAALQFLNSVQLRVLFTILIGVLSSATSLLVDLNDPFRGNFRITPSADQLLVIRQTLTEDGLREEGRLGCSMDPARAPITPSASTDA